MIKIEDDSQMKFTKFIPYEGYDESLKKNDVNQWYLVLTNGYENYD
jgi:hypothetical protein